MEPIKLYAVISGALVIYASWMLIKIKIDDEKIREEQKKNWWVFLVFGLIGALGLLSTIPGIIYNEPSWLLNRIFQFVT